MMRPLETTYQGRSLVLECTHKKQFPPPQMYGSTEEDIDILWRQGAISATQHQLLKTWRDRCGLMVMGPRCLDCPLALKQNPRPGRPHVIETEAWLPVKTRLHWEDMKAGRLDAAATEEQEKPEEPEPEEPEPEEPEEPEPEEQEEPEPEEPEPEEEEPEETLDGFGFPLTQPEESSEGDVPNEGTALEEGILPEDDSIIDALAKG